MGGKTYSVSKGVTEVISKPGIAYDLPGDPVRMSAVDIRPDLLKSRYLGLAHGIIDLLEIRPWSPRKTVLVISEQYPSTLTPTSKIIGSFFFSFLSVGTAWGNALLGPDATIEGKASLSAPASWARPQFA